MERRFGLIAAAGPLPARLAAEARRRGWRVIAFAFDGAPVLAAASDAYLRCRHPDIQAVLAEMIARQIRAVVFTSKRVLLAERDEAVRIAEAAGIAVVTVDDGVATGG